MDMLIVSCYFALTTLSTVGYGDFYPVSPKERLFTIAIEMAGVAFFSYIMGEFFVILQNYNVKVSLPDRSMDLCMWLVELQRFNQGTPLQKSVED